MLRQWWCWLLKRHVYDHKQFEPLEDRPVPPSGKCARIRWFRCDRCGHWRGEVWDGRSTFRYTVKDARPAYLDP